MGDIEEFQGVGIPSSLFPAPGVTAQGVVYHGVDRGPEDDLCPFQCGGEPFRVRLREGTVVMEDEIQGYDRVLQQRSKAYDARFNVPVAYKTVYCSPSHNEPLNKIGRASC